MSLRSIILRLLSARPTMYSGSLVLNLLGIHFFRVFFFYLRRVLRIPKPVPFRYVPLLQTLERDGIFVIPNFFPEDVHARIREEFQQLSSEFIRGHPSIPVPYVDQLSIYDKKVSVAFRGHFIHHPLIRDLPRAYLNRNYHLPLNIYLTRIHCNETELKLPQNGGTNNLHFDAPLRVLKAFFYISDADEKNAVLYYCIGSHKRNSLKRLLFEFKLSVRYVLNRWNPEHGGEYLSDEPWVKITEKEMHEHGLQETAMAVKGNTMIFVDTGGFHRRGAFLESGVRETVEINFREAETLRNDLYPLEQKFRAFST